VDVRDWDLARLRRHVGIIFQDTVLFTGTVAENLKLGVDGAVAPADLVRAVETARAAAFVAALPRGLDEALGERGANVSHGQRQLLAIARALVYNPAVLVLDEATSSVDAESEALIREAMAGLLAGRTSLTIAHRLATVQHAERIPVLPPGRIHEEGTHAGPARGLGPRLPPGARGPARPLVAGVELSAMMLALSLSFSCAQMSLDVYRILVVLRLCFYSVWSVESYGSDAVTPTAWIASLTT